MKLIFFKFRTNSTPGQEYLTQPPTFDNTFCCTASYDFIPYEWSNRISEHAISFHLQDETLVCVGQVFIYDKNMEYQRPTLCEIIPSKRQIRSIGINDNPYTQLNFDKCEVDI